MAAESQRMEDELRGRAEAVERTAAAAGHSDLGEEETPLEDRMAELRQRKNAILQSRFGHQPLPTLAAQEYNMGSLGSMVLDYRDIKERRSLFGMQQEYTGITDPAGWTLWEQAWFHRHLRAKDTSSAAERSTPATSQAPPSGFVPA
ncbi:hypothetical protein MMC31_003593, partial [Peltigera leucophlebia]|nr:hypothetical protein [Peltigera leucophlebia]